MAYNSANKYSGNSNRSFTKPATAATGGDKPSVGSGQKVENIFSTGLWTQEGGKSLATVQVREDIMIPAGSYINLYQTDAKFMKENSPHFKVTVRPGVLKAKE